MLQSSAKGSNVWGLYEKFDESVRRRVEVSYDVCKQPGVRFIERLFYQAPVHDASLQTYVLEHVTNKPRPFILSTPQLKLADTSVELQLPFGDPLWDDLHSGTCSGVELLERLRLHARNAARDMPLLEGMLASPRPRPQRDVPAPGQARVRYFGHACVLMESAMTSILFDPLISYPGESSLAHFTLDDLPERIDYVVLTHPHQDHVVLETLLRLRHKVGCVVVGCGGGGSPQDVSLKLMLEHCSFPRVVELGEYETLEFDGGRIIGAPFYGEHADLNIRGKLLFGVQMEGAHCAFFADSNPPSADFYEPHEEHDAEDRLHVPRHGMRGGSCELAVRAFPPEDAHPRRRPVAPARRLQWRQGDGAVAVPPAATGFRVCDGGRALDHAYDEHPVFGGLRAVQGGSLRSRRHCVPTATMARFSSARWSRSCEHMHSMSVSLAGTSSAKEIR